MVKGDRALLLLYKDRRYTMPNVFLSPSLQEFNPYVNGGNEEYYMNLIADAMQPYLSASGITFSRNNPSQTLSQAIAQSNQDNYDLHLAIHSNASGQGREGQNRGAEIYYYPTSANGERFATIIEDNYKQVYPIEDDIKIIPTTTLAEVRRTNAPAVLVEVAYHDNEQDADFIRQNIDNIARSLSQSIAQYLGVPFVDPNA